MATKVKILAPMLTLATTPEYQAMFRNESQPYCLLGGINASRGEILPHILDGGTAHHWEDSCRVSKA